MSIEAERGREYGWFRHLVLVRSRVVLCRADGKAFVLFSEQHWDDALAKRDRLRREVAQESFEGWSDRYVVPALFFSAD